MISNSGILVVGVVATLGLMGSTMVVAADTAPAPAAAPAAKPVATSNKWRVEFDGKADADGEIVFAMIVADSTTTVTTMVKKGDSENQVANLVVKALKKQAPPKKFQFETDDGEDVLFKKKVGMGAPDFGVVLVSNSVAGIKIDVKKE